MDLLLSLINITKSLSNVLAAVATVLSAEGRMEGDKEKGRERGKAYLFFSF